MNDYNELVQNLREEAEAVQAIEWDIPICTENHIREAADAIEQLARDNNVLTKERDAAVADINGTVCDACVKTGTKKCTGADGAAIFCNAFEWRGVQEEAIEAWNRRVNDATVVNAVPIVQGHWIEEDGIQICSNCGEEHEWGDYRASYCEDCGAKMDEEDSDGKTN